MKPQIDINVKDSFGMSALSRACCERGCSTIVNILIDTFEDLYINAVSNYGWTPLMLACFLGHSDMVHALMLRST